MAQPDLRSPPFAVSWKTSGFPIVNHAFSSILNGLDSRLDGIPVCRARPIRIHLDGRRSPRVVTREDHSSHSRCEWAALLRAAFEQVSEGGAMENTWSPFAHGTCARIDHHLPPLRALGVRDDVHGFVPMVLHLLGLPDTASPEVRGLLRLLFLRLGPLPTHPGPEGGGGSLLRRLLTVVQPTGPLSRYKRGISECPAKCYGPGTQADPRFSRLGLGPIAATIFSAPPNGPQ